MPLVHTTVLCCAVYSFGVICWEMFHGVRAWSGLNHAQARAQLQRSVSPRVARFLPTFRPLTAHVRPIPAPCRPSTHPALSHRASRIAGPEPAHCRLATRTESRLAYQSMACLQVLFQVWQKRARLRFPPPGHGFEDFTVRGGTSA